MVDPRPAQSGWRRGASLLLSRVVFASLLALIPLTAVPYGAVEPWWVAVFELAVFGLAALWAVEGALSGRWFARECLLLLPLLALLVYALAQTLPLWGGQAISYDPYGTRLVALKLLALLVPAALFCRYTTSERRLRAAVYAVVGVALASALFGIVRQAAQRGEHGFLLPHLLPNLGYAQFINKNHFAYLAEMALGLVAGLVVAGGIPRRWALAHIALAFPVWAALVLSNSRGGIFAMLCQFIFLAATFGTRTRARGHAQPAGEGDSRFRRLVSSRVAGLGLTALLLLAMTVGVVWVGGDPLAERIGAVGDEFAAGRGDAERTGRAEIWKATWEMIKAHPLAGVGFGGYWVAVSGYHDASGRSVPQEAHSDYLELLASGGVIGCALVLIFIALFISRARQRLRRGTPFARAAALGALTGILGVAVHSLFDFGLHVTANAYVFVTLVAIATVRVDDEYAEDILSKN